MVSPELPRPGIGVYGGLLLTTLSALAYQLLLTRIFSVTMWYHYSFMAVSVAMFGLTVGAILVYLLPRWFPAAAAVWQMGVAAFCFAVLIVGSFLVHLQIRFSPEISDSPGQLLVVAANYALLSLPFVAGGVCVTIALTRFPQQIGKLYAVDLIGAGLGCLLVALAARWIDPPTLILDVAVLAAFGAFNFAAGARWGRLLLVNLILLVVVGSVAVSAALPPGHHLRLFRPRWVKQQVEPQPLCERWNAFSRVAVWSARSEPIGWGLSRRLKQPEVEQLVLNVDAASGTVMTRFRGDLTPLEFLRYDVTNLAHYICPDARVLVIGSGGGRDVLSALVFGQREIVGVEVNETVLEMANGRYGYFTGHLDRRAEVSFVNDDARSYIARTERKFDLIQLALIDTFAASAAGAYVLTENGLYTVETWTRMVRRLSDRGMISATRWYTAQRPDEIYRLTALSVAALQRSEIADPEGHLIIVHRPSMPGDRFAESAATLLVSRAPFSPQQIDTVRRVADEMAFEVLLRPGATSDKTLRRLASGRDLDNFTRNYVTDITPPTDDRPFFFDMVRLRHLLNFRRPGAIGERINMLPIATLGTLLVAVVVLTGLCVIVPLWLTLDKASLAGSLPLLLYFSSIGLGFMLVEISLMQRLSLFLGHPIYGMTVVLFCLLTATGCGSWLSGAAVKDTLAGPRAPAWLAALAAAVLLVTLAAGGLLGQFDGASTPARIAIAGGPLLLLGLLLGMAFPLGMRLAGHRFAALTPWLFGINGATSICGSVLAIIISLSFGITAALTAGAACYLAAWLCFVWARRRCVN